jgi:hypothetical protein
MARSCIESVNAGEELALALETLKTGLFRAFRAESAGKNLSYSFRC